MTIRPRQTKKAIFEFVVMPENEVLHEVQFVSGNASLR